MILRDFLTGGFPITRRSPAVCMISDGSVKVAYNRFDLKNIINSSLVLNCIGVWPGKKNTDCFILDPDAYRNLAPPERYKDIDSAEDIKIFINPDGYFVKISYIPGAFSSDRTPHESEDMNLCSYIQTAGLKHSSEEVK